MFRGVTALTIDSKGRLAMPTRYREVLQLRAGGKLVVTSDSSLCLLIYPAPDWQPIEDRLMRLPSFNERTRNLQRRLVGYASDVEMDAVGRILLPAVLRKTAGLDKDVALVGQGTHFELWDKVKWVETMEQPVALTDADLPPELEGFSL